MAIRKSQSASSSNKSPSADTVRGQAKRRMRSMLLEHLEQRQLLTVAPQLIGIQPNNSDLLADGDVRNQAPRELVFRFDDAQVINAATLSGIRITSAGGDGSFQLATAQSGFGSNGEANIQLQAARPGQAWNVIVAQASLASGAAPTISVSGSDITITLNSNVASPTTAAQLIAAINASSALSGKLTAKLNGGLSTAVLGQSSTSGFSPISVDSTRDTILTPGAVLIGQSPNENEVTFRFAETLQDDNYRVEIFGFDDPFAGVTGLRNVSDSGGLGDLFQPSVAGTRKDTIDFRLDLGPQVQSVVPQPVVRVNGQLQQQRDTIVVYFDSDKLLVENDAAGNPTSRSVENPEFYQLIFTSDTVRNTDDVVFLPTDVHYNAVTNTATLRFSGDINDLPGAGVGPASYRLRIGTRESIPTAPTRSEAAATAVTDLNTGGAVKVRFTSRELGESGNGIQVNFVNTASGTPQISVAGRAVTIDLGRASLTAQELVNLFRASPASALMSIDLEPGSNASLPIGNANLSFSPVSLYGLGSSFNTASDLGVIGSSSKTLTSMILASAIDPEPFILDLPGASDDAGHRDLSQNLLGGFEDHVNKAFGADATDGITTIYYNFRSLYSFDNANNPLTNAINSVQKQRVREVLSLWANYVGVQFVETADQGVTIATGAMTGLSTLFGTQIQNKGTYGVRIDPTFNNSLIILSATNTWGNDYGDSYSRHFAAAMGMVLGLEHAGDLPETTLMRLDPTFLAGSGSLIDPNDFQLDATDELYEPILPGNQDILHAQHLYRPDGSDIDLFRFEVDFGGADRVGLLTAETYAQRLANSSALNTNLELFHEVQASATTSFGSTNPLTLRFEAVKPGALGNQLQVFFTQTERGDASKPTVLVYPNALSIDLNATPGSASTVRDIILAIQDSPAASALVKVSLVEGASTEVVGANVLTQNPVVLTGGQVELVAQNDDYFSQDSVLKQSLTSGVYYLGVSASGNDDYNASIEGTGFGGDSQGEYELRITFRAAVDASDTIQDLAMSGDTAVGLDGDNDGSPGGTYDFWFQTRPLDRSLFFNSGANAILEGRTVTVVGANGTTRTFEFSADTSITAGRVRIPYHQFSTAGDLANALAAAIVSRPELGVNATANGLQLTLTGERLITIDPLITQIDVSGKTIFVDKAAGPNADGSLEHPFNNISAAGVPNAFAATHPGDIVRIVGNGGADGNLATISDNFAYEIGAGLLPGSILSDGSTMDIPKGVTTMVDAGAIFKLRRARIGIGSANLNIDRSGASLQVLGAPLLLGADGNALRVGNADAVGRVYFTSWLDETIGLDTYAPQTTPSAGDWGGISFRRDVDGPAGRSDLASEGIFLQYVNNADIRYGGGTVIVDSVQQTVNPIQMLNMRPTITENIITRSASAAMSALPNSFEENNFNEPKFQASGAFTSDYERVGPEIHGNTLIGNSINGLFIRVDTPTTGTTQTLTVSGRFDDIDIVHVISENLVVTGAPGGAILDNTTPPADLISTAASVGGTLVPGAYNYKLTFFDRNGYESIPSNASVTQTLIANQTAISIAGLPSASGDFVGRRLYRSGPGGQGPYELVAVLDRATSTFHDIGKLLGGTLARDRADISNLTTTAFGTGTLAAGDYAYRVVMYDVAGREGLASMATPTVTVAANGAVSLTGLPTTQAGFVGRRIYRSAQGGTSPYVLIADLPDSTSAATTILTDSGSNLGTLLGAESLGVKRPRLNASLIIDPAAVIKLEAARIEGTFGANIIAEGVDGLPIVFTSKLDDTVGAGGTFDTNNNGSATQPSPRDWGGIYMAPTSTLSIDFGRLAYAGGVTKMDGTFRAFNTIELQQAQGRIANTLFENNADGFGGQGPGTRFGRLSNARATIFVRGTQPQIINNEFRNNIGSVITIDVNSMIDNLQPDSGRQTGAADRDPSFVTNHGPLIRGNRFENNDLNGLELRAADILTTASVWDDTDIVHVVYDEIFTGNVQHEGGLRLQSAPNESLVVKFDGYGSNFNDNLGAGLTANGQLTSATDRVGGTLHVLGQPGFPVVLTSLADDTVGAGLTPAGRPQTDTNNDGIGSIPQSADWRGLFLDQYSNDRNVVIAVETEDFFAAAPGPNGSPGTAQVLGELAENTSASSENQHLGFVVEGVLSQSEDVDVYSFSAVAGTEVWLDVDYTLNNLDLVLEVLDANGQLLARSDNSTAESADPSLIFRSNLVDPNSVNPLNARAQGNRTTSSGAIKEDGTTNPLDPGLRIRLPGSPGSRTTFYFRIRSASTNADAFTAGLTSGSYQVQVRMREQQEWAGSSINFADIRYATNGVHLKGLPGESPLIGEAMEDESVRNGEFYADNDVATGGGIAQGFFSANVGEQIGNRPQYVGNLLSTAKGAISVAGELSSNRDVDFYMLEIDQEDIVGSVAGGYASVVFDMDYADGLNRPDTSINIFREEFSQFGNQYRLIFSSDSSNIADDQGRPLSITDVEELSRGSVGTNDPYIGPVALPEGNYLVGISSAGYQPRTKIISPSNVKPLNSIKRIVDEAYNPGVTSAVPPTVPNFLPQTNVGSTGVLVSKSFDLGGYVAADLPAIYLDYTRTSGNFELFVRDASGAEFAIASSSDASLLQLLTGTNTLKIPLGSVQARPAAGGVTLKNFAGENGLSLVFRSDVAATNIDNIIIGFGERGESVGVGDEPILLQNGFIVAPSGDPAPPFAPGSVVSTRQFSLATYDAFFDGPQVAFDYEVFNGNLDVWVIDDATGQQVWLATTVAQNRPQNVTLLTAGAPLSDVLDISFFAGRSQLRVEFRARNDNPSRTSISNVFIQLANGSRVASGEPNPTYTNVLVPSTTITTGKYQLEIRTAENFFQSRRFGAPILTKAWDTNDRLADQITLVAPAGSSIQDGDSFSISDGGNSITFEFSLDATTALGHVAIRYAQTDADFIIARKIRDAINNPSVQSRLDVRAATSSGLDVGTAGRDVRINLHGSASFQTVSAANPAGEIQVIYHEGSSDKNVQRDQSQIIIQNSYIRESRDYGIWSEAAARLPDPRDAVSPFTFSAPLQAKPNLVGTQAVRNLLVPNDGVQGGLLPGLVVRNNVLEEGGLGGVSVMGETPIWMISPSLIPYFVVGTDPTRYSADYSPFVNNAGNNPPISHFGSYIDDGDLLVIDADRTRLEFEFEDIAGGAAGNPVAGSGQVEGDGYAGSSSIAWYRDTGGDFYQRLTCQNCTAFATNAYETMHALRDSILGSILVTNGTTQMIDVTVAESLLGPDPIAAPTSFSLGYPEYFNRPAVYLEGVTNMQWLDVPGGNGLPFDIRQLDLGEVPQPHARILNNTIIGTDGRASFNGEDALSESNDTIATAVQTWQGTSHNPLFYSDVGVIGDGGQPIAGGTGGSVAGPAAIGGGQVGGGAGATFSSNRLVLTFNDGVTEQQKNQLLANRGLEVLNRFDFINAIVVGTNGNDVEEVIGELGLLPEIRFAEPDYIRTVDLKSNDPQFPQQWHYDNQGQTGGKVDADIDLPEAWDSFTGSAQTVIAIIDTGVDYRHPDLAANMWVNPNEIAGDGIDNDNNGYIDDIYGIDPGEGDSDPMDADGHGTHVAGTTSAVGNNGAGVSGVNWNAKIMALKTADAAGGLSSVAIMASLQYMIDMKTNYGVNIVVSNNSYGGAGSSQAEQAAIQATIDAGILFVSSAGNSALDNDVNPHFPSNYPLDGIIAVAASDHNDQLAGFSHYGLTSVDLAAPGMDVLSTTLGGGYGLNSGTSMASPHVAGVAALLAGANPAATVNELKTAILLGADPIPSMTGTTVTGARLNAANSLLVTTAGLGSALLNTDVDIYQFKLGVGERAIVDIDTSGSGLDSVLQIFDARGIPQTFITSSGVSTTISDNDAAPGEIVALDPYADFTATAPGVYYAAVSSAGNTGFDPLSFANRTAGTSTGAYRITISALHLQDFVITAQDASAYNAGDTFTIYGVPEIGNTGSSGQTFEFVIGLGGPTNPNNIPININPDWRFPDVANAIARAVNEGGTNRGRAIPNTQLLPNGIFGLASPLPPVHARALGGLAGVLDAPFNNLNGDKDAILLQLGAVTGLGLGTKVSQRELERQLSGPYYEVNQGLELFPRRQDGFIVFTTTTIPDGTYTNITSMSNLGIGHDRESTNPLSHTSRGDGASEKFVVINNAAWIDGNGTIIVDPDDDANNNLDQLLPETGILASRGASPTILNNAFFNLQTPIINEESRVDDNTFAYAPYGSDNPNIVSKPGQVVIGGSIYQYDEPAVANVRFGTGIENGPTNVPNTSFDFNYDIPDGVRLFTNVQAGQYLPAAGSPLIDSAIDSVNERPSLADVKSAMGLALSPIIAPDYDLVGQLRTDDPAVSPPGGQGQNVFKDRGALERSDTIGPAAILLDPFDNDALGVDQDSTDSVVALNSGVYPEFRIQLADGNEPTNPLRGVGINDDTVISSIIEGQRLTGASVVVFEDGIMLQEGIDYSFAYNATRDEIILTPLAGVWKNGRVYEISVNNKDRFVVVAPAGDQVADGDTFTITDTDGATVVYEYDSGFRLQIPQGLTMNVPLAGGAFGGIVDGDRFSVQVGGTTRTFEFDRNGNILAGNTAIVFNLGATQQEITDLIVSAIQASGLSVTPSVIAPGKIFLGAEAGVVLDTTLTAIDQPATTLSFEIPSNGPRGGIIDGHFFTVSDGRNSETFEFDAGTGVAPGRTAIDFQTATTANDIAVLVQQAIANSTVKVNPSVVSGRWVHLGLSPNGSASVGTSLMKLVGIARTIQDGEKFTITGNGAFTTFEFTRDAAVTAGNVPIMFSVTESQTVIADRVVSAISAAGLGLRPKSVGDGNISVGGVVGNTIDVSGAPGVGLFGTPGVQGTTELRIFGPLVMQIPARGASDIIDGSVFSVSNNGVTRVFEFDGDASGPTLPGNVVITYTPLSTANDIATTIATAITGTNLGITASKLSGPQVSLGQIGAGQVQLGTTGLTTFRGVVSDGESFTISVGTQVVTFEFENVDVSNGFGSGSIPIRFSSTSTADSLVQSMKASIEGAGIGLTANVLPGGILQLNDSPRYSTDTTNAPTIIQSGVPGGAKQVFFIQDASFTGTDMKRSIIDAINQSANTSLEASDRGGNTLFVSNAATVSPDVESFYLRGVADLAGNLLKPNRINNETQFTILMPGVALDYGDTPDPVSTTFGRYPTKHVSDGARHVVGNVAILGPTISSEADGQPSPNASADSGDDGVVFAQSPSMLPVFNRNVMTAIDVTLNSPGYVDAWIDFNADGDWTDPGEQILTSARFTADTLTQTFLVTVPATAPAPTVATQTFARFRSSSVGGLLPTGLASDGEVEDYVVSIVPGDPPTAVDDNYVFNEDTILLTTDVTGNSTPGFTIDDGVAANDTDPNGGPFSVTLVEGPQHAVPGTFVLNSNGTFTYQPEADFNGTDSFIYRVNDGVLTSNNLGTVSIVVEPVNDAPVAVDDTRIIDEDTVVDVERSVYLANDSAGPANESGQTLTITGVDTVSAAGGSVQLIGTRVVYTPPSNYSGPDSFTYTITDNGTTAGVPAPLSATATVSITVLDKNDAPTTMPDNIATTEDTAVTVDPAVLIANDSAGPNLMGQGGDESSQTLQFVGVTPQSTNGGTVTFVAGVVTYTPPANFVGSDTFFYQVQDNGTSGGMADPQTSTGTVTVTVTGDNDAPRVASPLGTVTMQEDEAARSIDLSTVFVDPDANDPGSTETLTFTIISNSNTALVNPGITSGQLILELLPDQNGESIIVVQAQDSTGLVVTDTLTLTVSPVNDAPKLLQAIPDISVDEDGTPPQITLTPTYFFDPDLANGDTLTYAIVSNSSPLLVTPVFSGSTLTLNLTSNRNGGSQITVSATDSSGQTVSDTFILTVVPVNDVPVTTPETYVVQQGETLVTTDPTGAFGGTNDDGVLANDSDPEGLSLTAVLVSGPSAATSFTLNANGTFTYQHDFSKGRTSDSFVYRASDGSGQSVDTTVTITIDAPPPPKHQNPSEHMDVNADGFITPIDALLIINFLNGNSGGGSVANLPPPPPFRDVNGDNFITPSDVLIIINKLNADSRGGGSPEGESSVDESLAQTLAAAFSSTQIVQQSSENTRVGVRTVDRGEEFYGPLPATASELVFDGVGSNQSDAIDTSWVDQAKEEDREIPFDLALESLLVDLDPRADA
ncbi:MAG: tandem-95 repeat protein [Planctomycetales bacterium]|nr:tandem-95 repeat protein [Planctomycetales bacterium]